MQSSGSFTLSTDSYFQFVDITDLVQQAVADSAIADGICCLFNPHTTAGLTINEGCDPAVQDDLQGVFKEILPQGYPYKHDEGNSPSHVMATLTGCTLTLIIANSRIQLGTWQRIFFCEYDGPRSRKVNWKVLAG